MTNDITEGKLDQIRGKAEGKVQEQYGKAKRKINKATEE